MLLVLVAVIFMVVRYWMPNYFCELVLAGYKTRVIDYVVTHRSVQNVARCLLQQVMLIPTEFA